MIAWPAYPTQRIPVGKGEEVRVTAKGDALEVRRWRDMGRSWIPTGDAVQVPRRAAAALAAALVAGTERAA